MFSGSYIIGKLLLEIKSVEMWKRSGMCQKRIARPCDLLRCVQNTGGTLCAGFIWMWRCKHWVLGCESKVELPLARMQLMGSHLDQKAWFYWSFHWFGYFKTNPKIALQEGVLICRIWLVVVERLQILSFCFVVFLKYFVCLTQGSTKNWVWVGFGLVWSGLDGVVLMVNIWNFCSVSICTSAAGWLLAGIP